MKQTLAISIFVSLILFSCQKYSPSISKEDQKIFTKIDFLQIKNEVKFFVKNLNTAANRTELIKNTTGRIRSNSLTLNTSESECNSQLASQYMTSCFLGYYGELMIIDDQSNHHTVHTGLRNDIDISISNGYIGSYTNMGGVGLLRTAVGITNTCDLMLESLSSEQIALADNLQNNHALSDEQAEQTMINKIEEQENRVLNDPLISYDDKEYILTTLEIEKQSKDTYMSQYTNLVDINQTNYQTQSNSELISLASKKRSFFGKLWRGLAFVAISLASAGKLSVIIAAKAYAAANKAALFTAAAKKAYFALGVGIAWVPTGAQLVIQEKWNYDPWGSGSFTDWVKFGIGFAGVLDNPFWSI